MSPVAEPKADSVQSVMRAFAAGEIVVVTDDDDRENEGDLIVAASLCTPEKMAFIVRHTSGIVCAPMTETDARRLNLEPMVARNDSAHTTAFTVSVDYKHGTTTGISAEERTATCRALANPNAGALDFVRPGHVFPLIARDGGVLMRAGHTEAAVDLCRLASLPPVAVICELMNDDGTVMRGKQIADFAGRNGLKRLTIAELIAWRQAREKLIERVSEFDCDSPIGKLNGYSYRSPFDPVEHLAFVFGDIGAEDIVLTRFHKPNVIQDILGDAKIIKQVLARFKMNGSGLLVYLRDGVAGVPASSMSGTDSSEDMRKKVWREVGVGAQILRDLGVAKIRNLSLVDRPFVGLGGFGVELSATELLDPVD